MVFKYPNTNIHRLLYSIEKCFHNNSRLEFADI